VSILSRLLGVPTEQRTISEWDVPWGRDVFTSSTKVNELSALNLSSVWACETLIADAIATLPADTYRKDAGERVPTTPPGWLDSPNPVHSDRINFETQRVLSLLGWGNAYALLVRRRGSAFPTDEIIERWMLDPWSVSVNRVSLSQVEYRVHGMLVPSGNIQHVSGYVLPGDVRGMSVVAAARQSMSLGIAAEQFGDKFFQQGVQASGVLEVPQLGAEASQDVVDRLREMFSKRHAGAGNAGKPLVLTGGTTWKQTSVNPQDAQFLETRKFQVSEIARWFRVPPHMIGDVEKSTSWGTGIEQQALGFARHTLVPWITRLEQSDSRLLPGKQYVRFNLNAFTRADIKTRYEAYRIGREAGFLSPNEIRALEELPAIAEGDSYLQPLNFVPLGTEPGPVPGGTDPIPDETGGVTDD